MKQGKGSNCSSPFFLSVLTFLCTLAFLPPAGRAQGSCAPCEESGVVADITELGPEGIAEYRRAWMLWQRARQAWQQRKWAEVGPALDAVVAGFPGTHWEARARALRGLHFKFEGEWDAALTEFDRVLALAPPERLRHDVLTSRACILLSRGHFDEALGILEGIAGESRDWDQIKFVNSWIAEARRRRTQRYGAADSCGGKALAYLLRTRGNAVSAEQLAAVLPVAGDSTQVSLAALLRGAVDLGLEAVGVKVPLERIGAMPLPAIVLLKPGHYVVVTEVRDGRVSLFDPDRGLATYTTAVLGRKWAGFALLVGTDAPGPGLAMVEPDEMARIEGGVCPCCPQGSTGVSPQTVYHGGGNNGGNGPKCSGMPTFRINTNTLNLLVEDIDLAYQPPKGPGIEFRRTYNYYSSAESTVGRGWTHSYNVFLSEYPGGQVQVTRESGRIDTYVELGGGAYDPPSGITDALTKNPDGSFSLELWQERLRWNFTSEGLLANIVDRNGNAVTLNYTDNTPQIIGGGSTAGYLQYPYGVTVDGSGNVFVVDYGNQRIQKFLPDGTASVLYAGGMSAPWDLAVDAAGNSM